MYYIIDIGICECACVCGWNYIFVTAWLCEKFADSALKWPTDRSFLCLLQKEHRIPVSYCSYNIFKTRKWLKFESILCYTSPNLYQPAVPAYPTLRCHITVKHPNLLERAVCFNSYALPPHSPEHLSIIHIIMWDSRCPTLTREKNPPRQWTLFWSVCDVL